MGRRISGGDEVVVGEASRGGLLWDSSYVALSVMSSRTFRGCSRRTDQCIFAPAGR